MQPVPGQSVMNSAPDKSSKAPAPEVASLSVSDTLAALHVNAETGLAGADVEARRTEHGFNEVTEKNGHPVLALLSKFWGLSAWMLELIMVLSVVLGKYSDLAVVGALLVVNAVLSFMQEQRAAGVVETLRRRLQVSSRVRRESNWQVLPARELVPGDIVRVRPGDIIPADVKLLTGMLSVDQSALTGESKDADKAPGDVGFAYQGARHPMNAPRMELVPVTTRAISSVLVPIVMAVELRGFRHAWNKTKRVNRFSNSVP